MPEPAKPLLDPEQGAKLKAAIEDKPIAVPVPIRKPGKGRVIKETRRPDYDPRLQGRTGGKVVKAMPRQLQKLKQEQEKFEDDDGPRIEDLDD